MLKNLEKKCHPEGCEQISEDRTSKSTFCEISLLCNSIDLAFFRLAVVYLSPVQVSLSKNKSDAINRILSNLERKCLHLVVIMKFQRVPNEEGSVHI